MIQNAVRWLTSAIVASILIASTPFASAAASNAYDATKIDRSFLNEVLAAQTSDFDVIVRSTPSPASKRADRAATAIGKQGGKAKHALPIVGAATARLKGTQILKLTREPEVDYVVKDAKLRATFDPVADSAKAGTPGILEVGAPRAWSDLGVTGQGIGVAVVDSGVYAHADLAGRIAAAIDFTSAAPIVSTTPLGDPGGHGTHVAGLVAGDGTSSAGLYTGVAPRARIIDVRVIDATGTSTVSTILRGLQWLLANRNTYNVKVVNMSFGATPQGSYKSDLLATAAEILNFAGMTVVVAAGNGGPGAGTITTPGTDPYVVTVGALDDNQTATLADDLMPTWSARGRTTFDGLAKPDLVAPGRRMVSLRVPGSTLDTLYPDRQVTATGALTADYFRLSGTSMAAPVVSGVLALMYERNSSLSPAQMKKRLKSTVQPLAFGADLDRGAGMVNAYAAASSVDVSKDYASARVSDAFAKDMRRFIQGQPLVWRDLTYNGGVDSAGTTWEGVTWDKIQWDGTTWENLVWEGFTWEGISWEGITWEAVTWETPTVLTTNDSVSSWLALD